MTRLLSAIVCPAKRTRTLLWLSSHRNCPALVRTLIDPGPKNRSSYAGCNVVPLLPGTPLRGSPFSDDVPRPITSETPPLLVLPSLPGISSRQEREEGWRQEAQRARDRGLAHPREICG